MKHITTALLLMLLLAGCATPKTTSSPVSPTIPENFRNAVNDDTTSSIATLSWREFFTSKELIRLIDTALIRNNDLQIAIRDIDAAEQLVKKSKQGYLPNARLTVAGSNSIPSTNSLNGLTADQFLGTKSLNSYSASLDLSWEADIWGKVKNQKGEALANFLKTKEAKKAVQTKLIASIAAGYYNLLALDQQLAVAKQNFLLADTVLHMVELQFASAKTSSLAIQQEQAQRLVAAQLVPQLQRAIHIQENALSILTGVIPGAIERKLHLADICLPTDNTAGLPAALLSERPDVKANELELTAAGNRIGIARANLYPSLTLGASGGLASLKAGNWFNMPASLFGIVTAGLTQPLLQKRTLRTQYELAKIQREQAVFKFRQSVLTAFSEVSDALIKTEKWKEEYDFASQRSETLASAVTQARLLFNSSAATYIEVIHAQSNLLQTKLETVQLKKDILLSYVDLYRSLGGGWK